MVLLYMHAGYSLSSTASQVDRTLFAMQAFSLRLYLTRGALRRIMHQLWTIVPETSSIFLNDPTAWPFKRLPRARLVWVMGARHFADVLSFKLLILNGGQGRNRSAYALVECASY
jgi:hypothetical protein